MHAAMFQHDAAPYGQNYAFYLWFETELWADAVVRFECVFFCRDGRVPRGGDG